MRRGLESIFKNNEFGQLRTFVDLEGKPWIAGVDVARALGYKNPTNAVKTHCKPSRTIKHKMNNRLCSGNYEIIFIEESNFYRLVIKSTLPSAEKFQDWVVEEILPSLRETGKYEIKDETQEENEVSEEERLETIKEVAENDSHVKLLMSLLEEKEQELVKAKQAASLSNSGLVGFIMLSANLGLRHTTLKNLLEDLNFDINRYAFRRNDLGDVFLDKYIVREIMGSIKGMVSNYEKYHLEHKDKEDAAFRELVGITNETQLPF